MALLLLLDPRIAVPHLPRKDLFCGIGPHHKNCVIGVSCLPVFYESVPIFLACMCALTFTHVLPGAFLVLSKCCLQLCSVYPVSERSHVVKDGKFFMSLQSECILCDILGGNPYTVCVYDEVCWSI